MRRLPTTRPVDQPLSQLVGLPWRTLTLVPPTATLHMDVANGYQAADGAVR